MPLRLRMLAPDHSEPLFELINKNIDYLKNWFEWAHNLKSQSDADNFISQSIHKNRHNKSFDAGIWLADELVGVIGFHEINWTHKQVEIGYWISEAHQGKGLVKQSVQAMMTYAFREYSLNRIEILCDTHNLRSRALAEKLGYSFEGIEREGHHFLGRFFDVACYSFLAKEFKASGEEPYVQLARQIRAP
ncbi:MAG: GNAT family protein [Myxococcota bacterium]